MTAMIGLTKCSGCRRHLAADSFQRNRLNIPYKTCTSCRQRNKDNYVRKCSNTHQGETTNEPIPSLAQTDELPEIAAPLEEEPPHVVAPASDASETSSEVADVIVIPNENEEEEPAAGGDADRFIHDQEEFESFHSIYMYGLIETDENYTKGITAYGTFKRIKNRLCYREDVFESLQNYGINVFQFDDIVRNKWHRRDPDLIWILMHENVAFMYHRVKIDAEAKSVRFDAQGVRYVFLLFYDNVSGRIFAKSLPAIDVVKGFFLNLKHRGLRQCKLCFEKGTRRTIECSRCRQRICPPCFYQIQRTTWCPFCRYSLYDHIMGNIKTLEIENLVFDI